MKKFLFIVLVFVVLTPLIFFLKSFVKQEKPVINNVFLRPPKSFYEVGEAVELEIVLNIPLYLEFEKAELFLSKDIFLIEDMKYKKEYFVKSKKVTVKAKVTGIKSTLIDSGSLDLFMKGNKPIELKFKRNIVFSNEVDKTNKNPVLIKKIKLQQQKENQDTFLKRNRVWFFITGGLLILIVVIISVMKSIFRKRANNPYRIALNRLKNGEELNDILTCYLDSLFVTTLFSSTYEGKINIVKNLDINEEYKDFLIKFYDYEASKFLPNFVVKNTGLANFEKFIFEIYESVRGKK